MIAKLLLTVPLGIVLMNVFGMFSVRSIPVAVALYYLVFIFLPGYFLFRYFQGGMKINRLEAVPVSFVSGYVFMLPFSLAAYFLKMPLQTFIYLYSAAVSAWVLFHLFAAKNAQGLKMEKINAGPGKIAILVLCAAAGFFAADYFGGFTSGNFLVHAGIIRKMVSLGVIVNHSCYFADNNLNANMFSSYYIFLSMAARLTGADPVRMWIYLPQLIVPLALIANFCFVRRLFGSVNIALAYSLLYSVYFFFYNPTPPADGYAWYLSELAACNNHIAEQIFIPVILMVLFYYIRKDSNEQGGNRTLIFLPLMLLAQGTVHMYVQGQTHFIIYSLLFWALITRPGFIDNGKLLKSALVSSAALVFVAYLFALMNPNINPAYKILNGTGGSLPIEILGKWQIVDFKRVVLEDPMILAGTVMAVFALFYAKYDMPAFYIFALFINVSFIIYNPYIMKIASYVHPPLERVTRLNVIVPFLAASLYPLSLFYGRESSARAFSPRIKTAIVVFLVLTVVLLVKESPKRLSQVVYTKQYSLEQLDRNESFYGAIRNAVPPESVVMVNLPLTTWWTTYFPHYIVAHYFDFVLPPNVNQTKRKEDVNRFYSSALDGKSEQILRTYGVDYVFFLAAEAKGKNIEGSGYLMPVLSNNMFIICKTELK
ncbi:MAG: hypothetical protein ABII64_09250 [Elusimicrobiota bacterium]